MEKVLTNELRWIWRDDKKVLQQKWYFEWSNSYTWEYVPTFAENTTAKELLSDENIIKMSLEIGTKIKIGEKYASKYGFEPNKVIELVEGYFEEHNGLYPYTSTAPAIWNEEEKEFYSIFHLFGNDLEHFMDCTIL